MKTNLLLLTFLFAIQAVMAQDSSLSGNASDAKKNSVFNIADYGAVQGGADCSAALNAAYSAIASSPSRQGTIFIPPGVWYFDSQLKFDTKGVSVSLVGAGSASSTLYGDKFTGDQIVFTNQANVTVSDLQLRSSDATVTDFMVFIDGMAARNTPECQVHNTLCNTGGCGLWHLRGVIFPVVSDCRGDSNSGSVGGTCLYLDGCFGAISNCNFRTVSPQGYPSKGRPCVRINGPITSGMMSSCDFGGGAPLYSFGITGIESNASSFIVTTSGEHNFHPGDIVVIRHASVAGYNAVWYVAAVTADTITVNTTTNFGPSNGSGTAESIAAGVVVSNDNQYVNECRMSNILAEADNGAYDYGSASFLFDGRRGIQPLQTWLLTGLQVDYGSNGIVIEGQASGSPTNCTTNGFALAGCNGNASENAYILYDVGGVTITGSTISGGGQKNFGDYLGDPNVRQTRGVLIAAGGDTKWTAGITLTGNNFGAFRGYYYGGQEYCYDYGVGFTQFGTGLIDQVSISGNQLFGNKQAITSNPLIQSKNIDIHGNLSQEGSWPPASSPIPEIASAATLILKSGYDVQRITGSTNITQITTDAVLSPGMKFDLLFDSGLSLAAGGNIAQPLTITAGQSVRLIWDGKSWRHF